jgi:tetratricopeptide (TPR) repeat protein
MRNAFLRQTDRISREEQMINKLRCYRGFAAFIFLLSIVFSSIPAAAQGDLIPISDVTGGSSVFVLRGGSRAAPKKFISKVRSTRSKTQRLETAKKVSKQYTTLAKVNPRRTRTDAVDPKNLPPASKIKTMPRDEASRLFAGVGEYYMDRDDYNNAIDFFRESLSMDDKNSSATSGLSEALALKGNELLVKDSFPVAKTFFEEALKHNSKNAPAYFGLAEVLTEMGKESDAVANYENALKNDADLSEIFTPLGALYYQKGEIAKADEYLTKSVAVSPNDAQAQYYYGLVRFAQNKNEEALTALRKSSTLDATNAETFYYLGETLARLNRNKDAVPEYTRATVLRPNYFEAWFGLGSAEYELGNYEAAVVALTKATRLKNDNYEAFNNLADAYRQIRNYNQAEANYNHAAMFLQRQPNFNKDDAADMYSKAAFSIAKQCEINSKQRMPCRWDATVKALENAAALDVSGVDNANLGWAYYNAARADIAAGRTQEARPKLEKAKINLQKAAAGNSNFVAGPMLNLGMALTDLGEYPAAIDVLNKVVKKEPKWVFALNELGIAYRKQNNFKEAAAQFKRAIDKDKNFAFAYFNLGEAEFKAGNLGEARKAWDALKKMGRADLAAQLDVATNGGLRAGT